MQNQELPFHVSSRLLGATPGVLSPPWGTKTRTLTLLKSEDWWKLRCIIAEVYNFSLTCNLFWTFNLWASVEFLICTALSSIRIPLERMGPFVFKETSPQEEKEDQPVKTRLPNSWKRLKLLAVVIAKAWSVSMYMASFEPLFLFLPWPEEIPGSVMQGCLYSWCGALLLLLNGPKQFPMLSAWIVLPTLNSLGKLRPYYTHLAHTLLSGFQYFP